MQGRRDSNSTEGRNKQVNTNLRCRVCCSAGLEHSSDASRGNREGEQQPSTPPAPMVPVSPSSYLAFPFLARITPVHVSTLSFQESHLGEAISPLSPLLFFFPLETNQRQIHFIGCKGRATTHPASLCSHPKTTPERN